MNINQSRLQFNINDKIYATGVFLQPVKCVINNKEQWRWVAVGFEDETYFDGNFINVFDYSDTFEGLFAQEEE